MTHVVLGGTTLDILVSGLSRFPRVDENVDEFTEKSVVKLDHAPVFTIGGNGGNFAYALCRLGGTVDLYTCLGTDAPGKLVEQLISPLGCRYTSLGQTNRTSVNFCASDAKQHRYAFFYPAPFDRSRCMRALDALVLPQKPHLFLGGYPHPDIEVMEAWARKLKAHAGIVSIDIGPPLAGFTVSKLWGLLPSVDYLFCNAHELNALDATKPAGQIIETLTHHLDVTVVLKKGHEGSRFVDKQGFVHIPAFPIPQTSTVGAGDIFNAAFVYMHIEKQADVEASLTFANAVAAITLKKGLGSTGAPSASEVAAFLEQPYTG